MGVLAAAKEALAALRRKRPAIDHLVRAYARYLADEGDRLAAAVALPGFLSFFPLLALAFFVLGFVLSGSVETQRSVLDAVQGYLPGLLCSHQVPQFPCGRATIDIADVGSARAGAGVIGIVGLLIAGTGWVDALRAGIRSVWHQDVLAGNVVMVKLRDSVILAGLGVALLGSIVVSGVANSATSFVLDAIGLRGSTVGNIGVKAIGYAVSLAVNLGLFLFLFAALPKVRTPFRQVLRGALLAAVGFLVLQLLGAVYLTHTTGNPIYGTFAAVIGLLIWINIICRFTLFCAAWTVTAPYASDVAPSGTSSTLAAAAAGIPTEYAAGGADTPATPVGGGAPSPLRAALQGRPPPQAEGPREHREVARRATAAAPPVAPTAGTDGGRYAGADPRTRIPTASVPPLSVGQHAATAKAAGRATLGFVVVSATGLVLANARSLWRALRS